MPSLPRRRQARSPPHTHTRTDAPGKMPGNSVAGSAMLHPTLPAHRFCLAPMLDRTDRHCRAVFRQLTRHALLYTEMITTGALLHGDAERHLDFDPIEHPLGIQLGGSDPDAVAKCARLAEQWGYDEVNLNCGCPSDRVQAGRFGACLMKEPGLVADCVASMISAVRIPVTIKCRIGVDDQDDYNALANFVARVSAAGARRFTVHARKAWLHGLSPKENREIPPLDYPAVYRLKAEFPQLEIVLNGGLQELASAAAQLERVDGVMLGRAAYQNPSLLSTVDPLFYGAVPQSWPTIHAQLRNHLVHELACGIPLHRMTRHLLGLHQGLPGARAFRRQLSTRATRDDAGIDVWDAAIAEFLPPSNDTERTGTDP